MAPLQVPLMIRRRLAQLRRRELGLRLAWGAARWLAMVLALLAAACWLDWYIDRWQETPWGLRWAMLLVQAALWLAVGQWLILRPLCRPLRVRQLALWVEDKLPELDHRLITTVELNRPGAATKGMSAELIAAVASETEAYASAHRFADIADSRRLRWAALAVAPLLLLWALLMLAWPGTMSALLARQVLAEREIPRSVRVQCEKAEMAWLAEEPVVLRFRVEGKDISEDLQGFAVIARDGAKAETYPLEAEQIASNSEAVFLARVPASESDFTYRAWLGDGRTRLPGMVHIGSPPAIVQQRTWVQLPAYCGLRPDGQPYEEEQSRGDVAGLAGAKVRVTVTFHKAAARAKLQLFPTAEPEDPGSSASQKHLDKALPVREIDLALDDSRETARGAFDLRPAEAEYQIVAEDPYGFSSLNPPRRAIRVLPEDPPTVTLLPERFIEPGDEGSADDFDVTGMPVPFGGRIRIAYNCECRWGLGAAKLRYRIIPAPAAEAAEPAAKPRASASARETQPGGGTSDVAWDRLPLSEAKMPAGAGEFDPMTGCFERSRLGDQVAFYPLPSPDPQHRLGRTLGGGRFDFHTRYLPGLKIGDSIEFYVEVSGRNPDPAHEAGRSQTRTKTIVAQSDFMAWVSDTLAHAARLHGLEVKQRVVFGQQDAAADAAEVEPEPSASPAENLSQNPARGTEVDRNSGLIENSGRGSGTGSKNNP